LTQVKILRVDTFLPNSLRRLIVGEREIIVFNLDNKFYCLEARCTHAGAPLFEGEVEGDVIICPWHGSRFRISDGSLLWGPAGESLKVFSTIVNEGFLYVQFED
jgi:3-phenylpropionate/trans-cinnamate dioxygenase ferredoxin subunit